MLDHAARLEVLDRPARPSPPQVLVQVQALGICRSEHGRIGTYVVTQSMVIGHEAAGVIVAIGEGVKGRFVGERVALEPGAPCRRCRDCLAGRYNLCPDGVFFATPPTDGATSQPVAVDASFAHRVPDGLTDEQAAMAEPVSVGIWAARKAGISPGDRVLVTGGGPIGLLTAQVARAFGGVDVTVTDRSEFRLSVARQLGLRAHRANDPFCRSMTFSSSAQESRRRSPPGWQPLPELAGLCSSGWASTSSGSIYPSSKRARSRCPEPSGAPTHTPWPFSSSLPARSRSTR